MPMGIGMGTILSLQLVQHVLFPPGPIIPNADGGRVPHSAIAGTTSPIPYLDHKTPASSMLEPQAINLQ